VETLLSEPYFFCAWKCDKNQNSPNVYNEEDFQTSSFRDCFEVTKWRPKYF
jgi:hypothetical protein